MDCISEIRRPDTSKRKHYEPSKVVGVSFYPRLSFSGKMKKSAHFYDTLHSHTFLEVVLVNSGSGTVMMGIDTILTNSCWLILRELTGF